MNKRITITISILCPDSFDNIIEAFEKKLDAMIDNISDVEIDDFFVDEIRVDGIKEIE